MNNIILRRREFVWIICLHWHGSMNWWMRFFSCRSNQRKHFTLISRLIIYESAAFLKVFTFGGTHSVQQFIFFKRDGVTGIEISLSLYLVFRWNIWESKRSFDEGGGRTWDSWRSLEGGGGTKVLFASIDERETIGLVLLKAFIILRLLLVH